MAAMPVISRAFIESDEQAASPLPLQFVCSLCCDDISRDESITLAACNHQRCILCMRKWIEKHEYSRQAISPTCPFCRSSIHDHKVFVVLGRPLKKREALTQSDINEIDELTLQWLTDQTTLCPGCGSRVEKVDGCDHMTCLCGCKFCFECGEVRCICADDGVTYEGEEEPIRDDNGIVNQRLCMLRRNGRRIRVERAQRRCEKMTEEDNRWRCNDDHDSSFQYNPCGGRWLFAYRKSSKSVAALMQLCNFNSSSAHRQRYEKRRAKKKQRYEEMIEEQNRWISTYESVRNVYCDGNDSAFRL